eukprot:SAG11_NODE_17389_length_520_cov_0.952494_1_plen_46_part_10
MAFALGRVGVRAVRRLHVGSCQSARRRCHSTVAEAVADLGDPKAVR